MSLFSCKDRATQRVIKQFNLDITPRAAAISECVGLQNELGGSIEGGQSAARATGEPAVIGGKWTEVDGEISQVYKSSPESRQKIRYKPMGDRHSGDVLQQSFSQRADYIWQRASELDGDDKNRVVEQLFRDLTATVRALHGDIYDLQERLGEAMIRIDALEDWDRLDANPAFPDTLPGTSVPHHDQWSPHPPYPHFHGMHLIVGPEQDRKFHQGRISLHDLSYQDSPGQRRYLAAQREGGVNRPELSPREEFEEGRRFNQSKLKGDGGRA